MKREDLEKLGLSKEQIDAVMAENGKDVEAQKAKITTAQADVEALKKQVEGANKQIEDFKKLDVEGVKKAADEYKAKFETSQAESAKQLTQLKFDHALEGALTGAKAKNPKAVKALLDSNNLKLNEADGSILGLKEQLEKIQKENDYLFESGVPTPKIVTGGNNQQITTDAFTAAMRKGAQLPPEQGK